MNKESYRSSHSQAVTDFSGDESHPYIPKSPVGTLKENLERFKAQMQEQYTLSTLEKVQNPTAFHQFGQSPRNLADFDPPTMTLQTTQSVG